MVGRRSGTGGYPSPAGAPGPKGPVIDDLQLPASAVEGKAGLYVIDGSISFHAEDDAAVVSRLIIRVPSTESELTFGTGDQKRAVAAPLTLQILGPKQTLECLISVADSKGIESNSINVKIDLL